MGMTESGGSLCGVKFCFFMLPLQRNKAEKIGLKGEQRQGVFRMLFAWHTMKAVAERQQANYLSTSVKERSAKKLEVVFLITQYAVFAQAA